MITVSTHSNLILSQTWTNVGSPDTKIRAVCWPNKNRVGQNKCHQRVEMLHSSCTLQHYSYTLPSSAKRLLQKRDFKDKPFLYINEKKEKRKEKPWGLKTGEKKSDSCHIPSDKEVRYAWSEVKLQEWSGLCRKWSDREAYSFICDSYNSTKKPKLGVQINVSEADKHQ